jgi:hypothetical protein
MLLMPPPPKHTHLPPEAPPTFVLEIIPRLSCCHGVLVPCELRRQVLEVHAQLGIGDQPDATALRQAHDVLVLVHDQSQLPVHLKWNVAVIGLLLVSGGVTPTSSATGATPFQHEDPMYSCQRGTQCSECQTTPAVSCRFQ